MFWEGKFTRETIKQRIEKLLEGWKDCDTKVFVLRADETIDNPRDFFEKNLGRMGTPYRRAEDATINDRREQRTGELWFEVRYDPSVRDAYRHSRNAQPLHTDGSYIPTFFDSTLMTCVTSADEGGEATFIDPVDIVDALEAENPELLDRLRKPLPHARSGDRREEKVIDCESEPTLVNWNYYCVDKDIDAQQRATMEEFFNFLEGNPRLRQLVIGVKLMPGDALVRKDCEVLHWRNAFHPKAVSGASYGNARSMSGYSVSETRDPSCLILGTVRLHQAERDEAGWAHFFAAARERGISRLHVSNEYDSWPLFLHVLSQPAMPSNFTYVAKLAGLHFGEVGFDAERLAGRIALYCDELRTDRLEDVQWMWRSDLDDEDKRLAGFGAAAERIGEAGHQLRESGAILRLMCFPYLTGFADRAIESGSFDGLLVYSNLEQKVFEEHIIRAADTRMPTVAIRPFMAGTDIGSQGPTPGAQLAAVLDAKGVEAAILSTSSFSHLDEVLAGE